MSTDDLSILADALTFALLVTIGGLVVWGVVRATWRRPALRRAMKVCLSAAALVAVGLAGVALWPAARQSVTTAAGAAGIDVAQDASPTGFEDRDLGDPELVPSSPRGRTARVFEASTTSDGGALLVPSPFSDPGQAGSGSGSGGRVWIWIWFWFGLRCGAPGRRPGQPAWWRGRGRLRAAIDAATAAVFRTASAAALRTTTTTATLGDPTAAATHGDVAATTAGALGNVFGLAVGRTGNLTGPGATRTSVHSGA